MKNPKEITEMHKARGRFVNFRVTEEEFQQLKVACDRHGAPCMSAFARQVILNAPIANGASFADKLAALDRRLSVVEISTSREADGRTNSSDAVSISET